MKRYGLTESIDRQNSKEKIDARDRLLTISINCEFISVRGGPFGTLRTGLLNIV